MPRTATLPTPTPLTDLVPGLAALDDQLAGLERSRLQLTAATVERSEAHNAAMNEWRREMDAALIAGRADEIAPPPEPPAPVHRGDELSTLMRRREALDHRRRVLIGEHADAILDDARRVEAEVLDAIADRIGDLTAEMDTLAALSRRASDARGARNRAVAAGAAAGEPERVTSTPVEPGNVVRAAIERLSLIG